MQEAIQRTAGKHPWLMIGAVFLGCAIDVVVLFRG